MKHECSSVLNNLNIVLWKLRYPILLSKDIPIQLLVNIRLLMVSDIFINLNDPFIEDVIRAMHLNVTEVYIITVDRIDSIILSMKLLDYCWLIGTKIICNFCHVIFHTPSLSILKHNIDAKRNFWHQINRCL